MKIIIIHSDADIRKIIKTHLERLNYVVVHQDTTLNKIVLALAKCRPHLVVAEDPEPFLRNRVEIRLKELSIDVPVLWYPPGFTGAASEGWFTNEISRLLQPADSSALRRYTDESREVLRDSGYEPLEDGTKRNLPETSNEPSEGLAREMMSFGQQVESALQQHQAARRYLHQSLLTDKGLRLEVAYRAVHFSYKIYWLREHIFRWVGVLAHYLPGVEPAYLPPPATPSPKLDYLHYASAPENSYAATALLMHGFKPSWRSPLRSILDMKFTGQDEADLLKETLILAGWSSLLREIAVAQVRVMDCALQSDRPWYTEGLPSRALHRATQTFCDFWDLRHLRTNPHCLRIASDWVLVDGGRSLETLPVVPHFRNYV